MTSPSQTVLHIDSSARFEGSVTRDLTRDILAQIGGTVIRRDLADALPQINPAWLGANGTEADKRDAAQQEQLALSDTLIDEVQRADTLVIGVPLYNFTIPASLKAWIDQIYRAGRTFQYGPAGSTGLLNGKRAILAIATGGVPIDSPADFATPYLRFALGFIGITDVTVVAAPELMSNGDAALQAAQAQIKALAA